MNNHLIIGLGGTGGRVIRALRRTVYNEFRPHKEPVVFERDTHGNKTGKIQEHPVRLDYLYLDSSDELMKLDDSSWKIPDGTLQLGTASQILIGGGSLGNVLDNLPAFPGIKPWIGDRALWNHVLAGQINDALGGQKRRLGRFLFAANGAGFANTVETKVQGLCQQGVARCAIHICAGLAGGTGSGTIVDAISLVRKKFPNGTEYPIFLYVLLPEANSVRAKANYYANGYAALKELNAMSVGAYTPYDVTTGERLDFSTFTPNRSPFNGCYVITNINENDRVAGLDDPECEIHTIIGNFIYQKTVSVQDDEWSGRLLRVERTENGDCNGNLGTVAETLSGAKQAPASRGRQFLTFGMKRLEYPETEIEEFLRFSLARQSALQSLATNWNPTYGYVDNNPLAEKQVRDYIRKDETKALWRLEDGELLISRRNQAASYDKVQTEWETFARKAVEKIQQEQADHKRWLWELDEIFEAFYTGSSENRLLETPFRKTGVEAFYNQDRRMGAVNQDARTHADEIGAHVEKLLFENWKSGHISVLEAVMRLEAAREMVTEFRGRCATEITKAKSNAGETDDPISRGSALDLSEKNRREWAKIGPLSDKFGKRREMLEAQARLLTAIYTEKSMARAWSYAETLSGFLIEELNEIRQALQSLSNILLKVVVGGKDEQDKAFEGLDERIAKRCKVDDRENLADATIKIYAPKEIRDFVSGLVSDRTIMDSQCEAFRMEVCRLLDVRAGFRSFAREFGLFKLFETLEAQADKQVEACHNRHVSNSNGGQQSILKQNILACLKRRFPNGEQLAEFVHKVVKESGSYCKFDEAQVTMSGGGSWAGTQVTSTSVILPPAGTHTDELATVQKIMREKLGAPDMPAGTRTNAIVFLRLTNLFPLRYIKRVGELKHEFVKRLNGASDHEKARVTLEIFTEGDGSNWPDLFPISGEEIRRQAGYLTFAGRELGWIVRLNDPGDGHDLGWHYKDPNQIRPRALGLTEDLIIENADANFVNELDMRLRQALGNVETAAETKGRLLAGIERQEQEICTQYPNELHPTRIARLEALRTMKALVS